MNFNHILCPLDFSENNSKILDLAIKLSDDNATITLYHHSVLVLPTHPEEAAAVFEAAEIAKTGNIRQLEDLASELKEKYPKLNFKTYHSYLKTLTEELKEVVDKENVDLIVLGTHGRSGISRLLMGSVAEDILRESTCPVFMVKF